MAKPKIPHGYYRDPRTGRLKKKQTRRRQTGKGHRKQKGGGIAAAALPLAKILYDSDFESDAFAATSNAFFSVADKLS